jgi:hypothetical protein
MLMALVTRVGMERNRLLLISVMIAATVAPLAPRPSSASPQPSAPAAVHDTTFWRAIIQRDYAPPDGASVGQLSGELSALLGSPDPEQRDGIAYTILTAWIYRQRSLGPDAVRPLVAGWLGNLKTDIGTTGTDAVLRRSFSALMLSVVIARDNADPFLAPREFRRIFDDALEYLRTEQDVRGYDPRLGWMHSAAHTADLLKFLARSAQVTKDDQRAMLEAIAGKMRTAPAVFVYGEDERMARALLSLVNRADFDQEGFRSWLMRTRPVNPATVLPDPAVLRGNQNVKNLFAKLEVLLSLDGSAPAIEAARTEVRAALKDLY